MKKSTGSIFLALVFLMVLLSGCAPAPTPAPPTITPKPTSTATPLPSVTPTSVPTDTPTTTPDPSHPSVAKIQTVEFIGKEFELKFKATDQPVHIYEYYVPSENSSDWIELVEIQIYPVNLDGNEPMDFANRTAAAFMQQYPDMRYALLSDNNSDAVILDFFYPTSTRKETGKEFIEWDAFKFFRDVDSEQVIGFHYAKNIEGISSSRPANDVLSDINKTRETIEAAMAEFSLFNP